MAAKRWSPTRVDELIRRGVLALNDGYRVRNAELGRFGVPFVRGGDIGDGDISTEVEDHVLPEFADRIRSKLTQPYDIAFITKGTVGRVGLLRPGQPPAVFAPQVCYWRSLDRDQLDPRFLFYLLKSDEFQANLNAVKTHGSMAADYVSLSDQRHFNLTIPPPTEQKAIARILGTLDDKIELNRRMNATLEAMARALFQSWFVDAIPDDAPLPEGWELSTIGAEAKVVGGSTPSTKNHEFWENGEFHWVTPKDFSSLQSKVLIDSSRKVTQAGLDQITSGLLPENTVLLSSRAPVGYLALTKIRTAINQGFIAMICHSRLSPEYVMLWADSIMDKIKQAASGTTFAEISKATFRPFPIIVPSAERLNQFTSIVRAFYERIAANERKRPTFDHADRP